MKLIIAGTRTFKDYDYFKSVVMKNLTEMPTEIISGGAKGTDTLAQEYADEYEIPFTEFPANWEKHGKSAGPIRNREMASHGTHCLVFWDGKSRGTTNMIDIAIGKNLPLVVHNYIKKESIKVN